MIMSEVEKENKLKTLRDLGETSIYGILPERAFIKTIYSKRKLQEAAIKWINHFEEKKKQMKGVKILSGIDINEALINWIKDFFALSDLDIEIYNRDANEKK